MGLGWMRTASSSNQSWRSPRGNLSDQHPPELRIFRDAVPIAAGMAVRSGGRWEYQTSRGQRYLDHKYPAELAQTPPVPPGRLGKEGAVRSEMQITLDWVSPSQTSPRRTHSQPRLSRSRLMIFRERFTSTKGRAGRGFVSSALRSVWSCSAHTSASFMRPQRRPELGTPRQGKIVRSSVPISLTGTDPPWDLEHASTA